VFWLCADIPFFSFVIFRLVNTLKPGSVKKINRIESGSFKQFKDMENIENFLKAIEVYGVSMADKFGTPNLTDRNNGMAIVLNCIHAVGRAVSLWTIMITVNYLGNIIE